MAWWIVDQLVQQGVNCFYLAPGSRSTPLALATARHRGAKIYVHYDERGLGFFALGAAKAKKSATALIVTSGTAVGNLLPAVMEAYHSRAAFILLTADRPPELIETGANQTCDQIKLFTHFVRSHVHLPTADQQTQESYVRSSLAQAVCLTREDPGPIHINWHIREPLFTLPLPSLPEGRPIEAILSNKIPSESTNVSGLGAIVIGKLPKETDLTPILELAHKLRWPVFADILSQARLQMTEEQIVHFDRLLGKNPPAAETLIHFGERITAKSILSWKAKAHHIHVSPWKELQDPSRSVTKRILADIPAFCASVHAEAAPETWLAFWKEQDRAAHIEMQSEQTFSSDPEPLAFQELAACFQPNWSLYLGSSMPIRNADHFFFPACKSMQGRIFSNRGLSGIDGNIATAAGLTEGLQGPLIAWIGDQAALYDLNSLPLLQHTKHPVMLVISNNFGGKIFSRLPIAKATEHFEKFWTNPHSWQFSHAAKMFKLPYLKAQSVEELTSIFQQPWDSSLVVEWIS